MGEIGLPRREFLYDISFCEVNLIIRGYRRREQGEWERARWQTFWIMHNGMADLRKAGISKPSDLIEFPWDKADVDFSSLPTDEEVERMRAELQKLNKRK